MHHPLPIVLVLAGVFQVGEIWWCEDCGRGGFVGRAERHRQRCRMLGGRG